MTLQMSSKSHVSKQSSQRSTFCGYQRQPPPLYPACFYSNHVFARIDSCAAKGLSLTGKLLRVSLDAAISGCEWEAEREAAFRFHYGAEGRAGKSLPTGENATVDECARPG